MLWSSVLLVLLSLALPIILGIGFFSPTPSGNAGSLSNVHSDNTTMNWFGTISVEIISCLIFLLVVYRLWNACSQCL